MIELLIALLILAIVITLAYGGVVQGLRVQSSQEAATASQARLRRVAEVFTQELRGAILGAVSDSPYASDSSAVSFMLLDGGAGYQVRGASGTGIEIVAPATSASEFSLSGRQAMLVDAGGRAVVFRVNSVSGVGGGGYTWNVVATRSDCFDGLSLTGGSNQNALLFAVRTIGTRYDAGSGTLFQTESSGDEVPMAFDLTDVGIEYVYREINTGVLHVFDEPRRVDGLPAKQAQIGTQPVSLERLQLHFESSGRSLLGDVTRGYQAQVDLSSNQSFNIRAVRSCI